MIIEEIARRIERIRTMAEDNASAHSMEDFLYEEFIEYIASLTQGNVCELAKKAKLILSTKEINFDRWYS